MVEPDIAVMEVSGRLSLGNTLLSIESSIMKLIEGGARKLVIDVTGLTYIDSSAIGMLIGSNGLMEQAGGSLQVAGAQGLVAKAFDVVHLDRIVTLAPDLDSATRSLGAGA